MTDERDIDNVLSGEAQYIMGRIRFLEKALAFTANKLPPLDLKCISVEIDSLDATPLDKLSIQFSEGFRDGRKNLVSLLIKSPDSSEEK